MLRPAIFRIRIGRTETKQRKFQISCGIQRDFSLRFFLLLRTMKQNRLKFETLHCLILYKSHKMYFSAKISIRTI